ncbi:MAG TPA: NAD(P)-binding oxidoreductase [Euzebya sp.]|nr:NAD(P)-binding oxidoreductase [Euzebya sp.]
MDIAIAGAHGRVARHLTRLLHARGDRVRGLIRDPDQAEDIRIDGGEPVVCDLEEAMVEEVTEVVRGCDAVVFAAGAGPGSGAARKATMDRDGAVLLVAAAQAAGVGRYVMLSAMGTDDPPADPDEDDVFAVYLAAKAAADRAVMASDLSWTVVRPGRLTDDPPSGLVTLARHVDRGKVPRADVAAVLDAVLQDDRTVGHVVEVVEGGTPIQDAVDTLVV